MPKNFSALRRFEIIDETIRSGHYPDKDDFIDAIYEAMDIEVSERTVQGDLKNMKADPGIKAPIAYHRVRKGYYYTDPNYVLKRTPLTSEDMAALYFVANVYLDRMRDLPIIQQSLATIDKVVDAVRISQNAGEGSTSYIQFAAGDYQAGAENLVALAKAREDHKAVRFSYRKFGTDEVREHVGSPQLLKEFNQRWYVVMYLAGKSFATTFGLERMSNIELVDDPPFRFLPGFDPDAYFKHSFGVFVTQDDPIDLVLSFTPFQGEFVKTQPLHPTQELLADNDEECRVRLTVYPTVEVVNRVLSFGDEVKVIAPDSFAATIREKVQKMHALYS